VASCVRLHYSPQGGHVGFHAGHPRRRGDWLADYLLASFDAHH
jgi:predicted alpha/beta-fold hydrolase